LFFHFAFFVFGSKRQEEKKIWQYTQKSVGYLLKDFIRGFCKTLAKAGVVWYYNSCVTATDMR
jgi:hypothetical protein